jgi:type II secretory ATPase GspE/PulE/Tfp pilus assembly ATPase PilB-like protein
VPAGCTDCRQTGYSGRLMVCELLDPRHPDVARRIVPEMVTDELQNVAIAAGMRSIGQRARDAIRAGRTSPAEVRRVLGRCDVDPPAT